MTSDNSILSHIVNIDNFPLSALPLRVVLLQSWRRNQQTSDKQTVLISTQ
jgi:hypothetical protein